ncbi:unnamed protein product [Trichobilharzia regenti]|nr:unnamed protein product [Trichobilharzia regenti]
MGGTSLTPTISTATIKNIFDNNINNNNNNDNLTNMHFSTTTTSCCATPTHTVNIFTSNKSTDSIKSIVPSSYMPSSSKTNS